MSAMLTVGGWSEAAAEAVYRRHHAAAYRMARNMGRGDAQAAAEIEAAAFASLFRGCQGLACDEGTLGRELAREVLRAGMRWARERQEGAGDGTHN